MDNVEIPRERLHDSGNSASFFGILIALVTAVVGSVLLGAGYGAIMAISGNIWFNLCLAGSIPFWVNTPAGLGALFGHLQSPRWRTTIRLTGFVLCLYSICVGWLACVLDGPGLVFHPLELFGHLTDPHVYGLWIVNWDLEPEVLSLHTYLMVIRFGELFWIAKAALMAGGGPLPYPYCQNCKCFMWDDAELRLKYDPPTHDEARLLTEALVHEQYGPLLMLDKPVDCPKDKGLDIKVFRCEKCENQHTLNASWFPPTPDPEKSETLNMLEAAGGIELVVSLKIPPEIFEHFKHLAAQATEEDAQEIKKAA